MRPTYVSSGARRVGPILLLVGLLLMAYPLAASTARAPSPMAGPGHAAVPFPTHLPAALGGRAIPASPGGPIWWNDSANQTTAPSVRNSFAMASDPAANITLLFGGITATAAGKQFPTATDTWEFTAGAWKQVTSTAGTPPNPRAGAVMTYDAADGYFLLFGGFNHPIGGYGLYDTDTWTFNLTTGKWANITATLTTSPEGRYFPAMAYDPVDKEVVMFGGGLGGLPNGVGVKGTQETWVYKAGAWTNLTSTIGLGSSPPARQQTMLAWDGNDRELLLFGGAKSSAGTLNDTWSFVHGAWTNRTTTGVVLPSVRAGMMATDWSDGGSVVLWGGYNSSSSYYDNATYIYSDQRWHAEGRFAGLAPYNNVWYGAGLGGMVFDNSTHAVLLFGGYGFMGVLGGNIGNFNATWLFHWGNISSYLTSNRTQVPVNSPITLTALGRGGTWNYSYTYTNLPSPCTTQNVSILACTPTTTGLYNVTVSIGDAYGVLTVSKVVAILVYSALSPTLTVWPAAIDQGHSTFFNTTITGGSNGTHSFTYAGFPKGCSTQSAAHVVCTPSTLGTGSFSITVNITDSVGDKASAGPQPLTVYPKLGVSLGGGPRKPIALDAGSTLYLNATPSGGDATFHYAWSGLPPGCSSIDTANYSCVPTPAAFANDAPLHLKPMVTLTDGTNGATNTTVPVIVWPQLGGNVNVLPATGPTPLTVQFFGNVTGGAGGSAQILVTWLFDDGSRQALTPNTLNFSSETVDANAFTTVGTHSVAFWANDSLGYSVSFVRTVNVTPPVPPINGNVTSNHPTGVDALAPINFTVSATGGVAPYTYNWSVVTGCLSNGATFLCVPPAKISTYNLYVQVTVVDHRGVSKTLAAVQVSVFPALQASIGYTPASSCGSSSVALTTVIAGGRPSYNVSWALPGSVAATGATASFDATAGTNYSVRAVASDAFGGVAVANTFVQLRTCSSTGTSSSNFPLLPVGILVGVLVVVALVAAIMLSRRRRNEEEMGPSPPEPEEAPKPDPVAAAAASSDEFVWGSDQAPSEETAAMAKEGAGYGRGPPPSD